MSNRVNNNKNNYNNNNRYNNNGKQGHTQIKASQNVVNLVDSYVEDEGVKADLIDAIEQMRPKSYGQIFNGIFKFSKRTLFVFHCFSLLIASPLIFSLCWQLVLKRSHGELKALFDAIISDVSNIFSPMFLIPAVITIVLLGLFEYGQHVTLSSFWLSYFQLKKKIIPGLLGLAIVFSLASLATSGYGAKEFVVTQKADPAAVGDINAQLKDALALRNQQADRSNTIVRKRDSEIEYLRQQKQAILGANKEQVESYSFMMVCIALFVELCIITGTFNIFNYKYKATKEAILINDMYKGEDFGNLFSSYAVSQGTKKEQIQRNNGSTQYSNGQHSNGQHSNGQYTKGQKSHNNGKVNGSKNKTNYEKKFFG